MEGFPYILELSSKPHLLQNDHMDLGIASCIAFQFLFTVGHGLTDKNVKKHSPRRARHNGTPKLILGVLRQICQDSRSAPICMLYAACNSGLSVLFT